MSMRAGGLDLNHHALHEERLGRMLCRQQKTPGPKRTMTVLIITFFLKSYISILRIDTCRLVLHVVMVMVVPYCCHTPM